MRKKKSRFKFDEKSGSIIVARDDKTYIKESPNIRYLGEFGYHFSHKEQVTVLHLPTGMDVAYCYDEKQAIIIVKKLFLNIKKGEFSELVNDPFDIFFKLQKLVSNIRKVMHWKTTPIRLERDDILGKRRIKGKKCPVCGSKIYQTTSGSVCEKGHGGVHPIPIDVPLPDGSEQDPDDDIPF